MDEESRMITKAYKKHRQSIADNENLQEPINENAGTQTGLVNQNISIQHAATALQSKIIVNLSSKSKLGLNILL